MISDWILTVMEWIGTGAFSVSGGLTAISCGLDFFGVLTVGCVSAVGGGIVRDLLIGNVPPQIFFQPRILLIAVLSSCLVFLIAFFNAKRFVGLREKVEQINLVFDALGLAAFTVAGIEVTRQSDPSFGFLLLCVSGVITGVGGGILRDVLVNEKPYVLTKHIYAVASMIGSVLYCIFSVFLFLPVIGTVVSVSSVFLIRLLAALFHWKLPKVKFPDPTKEQNDEMIEF